MARVYMASGGYGKAQPLLESALSLARKTEAADAEICACALDLAFLYKNQGKLARAETMCRSGLELQERLHGPNHPHVAQTLRILSEICQGQARYDEAASCLERAIAVMRAVSSEDDPDLAPLKVDTARLLVTQGEYSKAWSYFSEALSVLESTYGPDHVYTAKVLASMAALCCLQGRYAQADELTSRALPILERVYGPSHYFLVPAWLTMSRTSQAKGDIVNTKRWLEKSLVAVAGHDSTPFLEVDILSRMAELHILCDEQAEAERVLQRALRLLDESHAANNDRTATALNLLAKVRISDGKYDEAHRLCRRSLDILEAVFDENHPNVAPVLSTMAALCRRTGDETEAARLERRIKQIRGPEHVGSSAPDGTV